MRVGSLFSGIGGLELGLERAGMEVVWQVEKDDYCRRVLAKHWPDVTRYEDVHDVGGPNLEPVDLICGGFPCQPVSQAGKRLAQADERWLWPEFARIIRELRPRYALMENVPGLLVRGFGGVLGDLAAAGYDAEWCVLGADDVGAPHRRKRVFIVAHTASPRRAEGIRGTCRAARNGAWRSRPERLGAEMALTEGVGRERDGSSWEPQPTTRQPQGEPPGRQSAAIRDTHGEHEGSIGEPRGRTYAEPARGGWWTTEPDVGRVAHGVPARVDRLRALGNAVVPQVAEWIGRRIMEGGRVDA